MNNKAPYEIIITEKAVQLPVPDMADFIWGRIEAGLDAVAAQENNESNPQQKLRSKPARRSLIRNGIIITAAAIITVVTVWLITKRKKNAATNKVIPVITAPATKNTVTDSSTGKLPPQGNAVPPEKENKSLKDVPLLKKGDSINLVYPSPVQQQAAPIRNDSIISPFNRFVPAPDSAKTSPPPSKKPRGIKGISDSDYKIIMTKKDSAGKKN